MSELIQRPISSRSARTKAALDHLKSQDFQTGQAPFGFISRPRTQWERENKVRRPLTKNPEEQKIMARIDELHSAGKTWPSIAASLNVEGHRTRSGGEWQYQAVHRIFTKVISKRAA